MEYGEDSGKRNKLEETVLRYMDDEDCSLMELYPFEIHFENEEGEEIQPEGPVTVSVSFKKPVEETTENSLSWAVFHVDDEGETEELTDASVDMEEDRILGFTFRSEHFSDFVLAGIGTVMAVSLNAEDLEGTVALVNGANSVAMLAEQTQDGNTKTLKGETVEVEGDEDSRLLWVQSDVEKYKTWRFEKISEDEDTYYLTTGEGDQKQCVRIEGNNVTLVEWGNATPNNATPITVQEGEEPYEGMVRLKSQKEDKAINLYGGKAERGFGGWSDNKENEWFYVISEVKRTAEAGTVEGITPASSRIHMFDYWTTERVSENPAGDFGETISGVRDSGINHGHSLKFAKDGGNYTHSAKPETGLVKNVLVNGYPVLKDGGESLSYLFDPDELVNVGGKEYKKSFRNVKDLLQVDADGYYYYNSQKNFAELNEDEDGDENRITLYERWGVYTSGTGPKGQFFPFNKLKLLRKRRRQRK